MNSKSANTSSECPVEALNVELCNALKAAGDTLRLQVLAVLAQESFGVLELCQVFETKQSGMSHHLKVLAAAKLVATRREGNTIFYRRNDTPTNTALDALRLAIFSAANQITLDTKRAAHLHTVQQARASASRAFFVEHASAFREQQDLIAEFNVYAPEVSKVIDASGYPENARALEIGPGNGEFLPELSQRFNHVIALDSAEAMLTESKKLATQLALNNIEFVHADTQYCRSTAHNFDCVVINMVLHHTPSPSQIFEDVGACLKPGGVLIVCDLGAHNQDWVRQACGDQWLGFDAEDLKKWARNGQLSEGVSRYFALRNGFQIQIHQFTKT